MTESAASRVYRVLRRRILTGEIPAQQPLIETALAEELKISRTPIREAIFQLKKDRLVMSVAGGGVIARDVAQELKEILGVRKALEVYAIKLAIDLIDDDELDELQRVCDAASTLDVSDTATKASLNQDFHELIVAAAGNGRLYQMWLECREYFQIAQEAFPQNFDGFHQHVDILQALKKRDKQLAEELIISHLDKSLAAVIGKHRKGAIRAPSVRQTSKLNPTN